MQGNNRGKKVVKGEPSEESNTKNVDRSDLDYVENDKGKSIN